eukprot:4595399-Alexandrium_andersonii.AAC.1
MLIRDDGGQPSSRQRGRSPFNPTPEVGHPRFVDVLLGLDGEAVAKQLPARREVLGVAGKVEVVNVDDEEKLEAGGE